MDEEVVLFEEWRTAGAMYDWTGPDIERPRLLPGTEDLIEDLTITHYEALRHRPAGRLGRTLGATEPRRVDGFASVDGMDHAMPSPNRLALSATIHCLTGCAIGEVLGMVIATALGWHDLAVGAPGDRSGVRVRLCPDHPSARRQRHAAPPCRATGASRRTRCRS